jgi:hypothetical protein
MPSDTIGENFREAPNIAIEIVFFDNSPAACRP